MRQLRTLGLLATASSVSCVGPVSLGGLAGRSSLGVLHERLVGGDFHVGLRGETALTGADDFSMNVRIRMRVRAFCD